MGKFRYPPIWKNNVIPFSNQSMPQIDLVSYLVTEHQKGKIPLVIAGSGVSSNFLEKLGNNKKINFNDGLPSLREMIIFLKNRVNYAEKNGANDELRSLTRLFNIIPENSNNYDFIEKVDREWLSKVFSTFAVSNSKDILTIWKEFCNWFFFDCVSVGTEKGGVLDIDTSKAAREIAKLYFSLDAICLSANFDDFIEYALIGDPHCNPNKGISLYNFKNVDKYFKRNLRGAKTFSSIAHNRCVLHANGDVFWFHCSGDKDEGYCPREGKYMPTFTSKRYLSDNKLVCEICGSTMIASMTMPGTYEKDHNTRNILSGIWENISSKISCIITVGLSCNWDDVLLKFIISLLLERDIPHFDINNFSEPTNKYNSTLVEKVVKEERFQSSCLKADAQIGLRWLNDTIEEKTKKYDTFDTDSFRDEILEILSDEPIIKRLAKVSQLGLKSYWLRSKFKNDRWEHSQEVSDISLKIYKSLCENSKKAENIFEKVLIYTAGLLHDCGHLPFSHLLEEIFEELSWRLFREETTFKHSHYTKYIIRTICKQNGSRVNSFLKKYGVDYEEIIDLIDGNYGIGYIDTLINSAVDADKIAYIFTDAERTRQSLMLDKESFINRLIKKAYITQEGFVALDGSSAWYAMRLLDERKRMYDELYQNTKIRCLEAAVKYIITTYFVQKFNIYNFDDLFDFHAINDETPQDLGSYRILKTIQDIFDIINKREQYKEQDLSDSLGEIAKKGIETCMNIVMSTLQDIPQMPLDSNQPVEPDELYLLKSIYIQLMGHSFVPNPYYANIDEIGILNPYQDEQILNFSEHLSYEDLYAIRKKIILNYPGTILIDLYKPARYFSSPLARLPKHRLDGTFSQQDTIIMPDSPRDQWLDKDCKSSISLSEYAKKYIKEENINKPIFQIFKIGQDDADCEHAINMLKKEMKRLL